MNRLHAACIFGKQQRRLHGIESQQINTPWHHRALLTGVLLAALTRTLHGQVATAPPTSGNPPASTVDDAQAADAAAKDAAQNPVAAAISVPFQNNTSYDVGPYRRAANVLLIQPVIPIKVSTKWIVITRTITPVLVQPRLSPTAGSVYGLGNVQPQFYLSPAHPGKFIWGAGPQLYIPSATDQALGINKWGGGPAFVGLAHSGHWLGGSLVSQQFAGVRNRHVSQMLINPFLIYNMKHGFYFVSSPIMTADWTVQRSQRWTVPLGAGVGRVFKIGSQPINTRAELFNNVRTTAGGGSWQLQVQVQLLFIRSKTKH